MSLVASMTRTQRWVSYAIGAFGLAMNAQSSFLIPLRARELGASYEVIGLLVASGAVIAALFSVVLGSVSDRLGPRRAFILGTGLAAIAAASFVTATSYWALLPLQLVLGASRALGWISSQAYITSIGSKQERAMLAGRFSMFSNIGPMIGPLIAGAVAQFVGLRWAFLALAGYSLVFFLMGFLLAPVGGSSAGGGRKKGVGLREAGSMFRVRGMQIVLLLSGTRLWINWVWQAFFPVLLADAGVEPGFVGTVVFVRALVSTVTAPTTGYWTKVMSTPVATSMGLSFGVLGILVAPFVTSIPAAFLSSAAVGISIGISLPLLLALTGDVVSEQQRGVALGLRTSINQGAAMSAPLVMGPLIAALGAGAAFGIGGLFAGSLMAAALWLFHTATQSIEVDDVGDDGTDEDDARPDVAQAPHEERKP